MIFSEPFNLEHIKPSKKSIEVEQVVEIVKLMKEEQSNYSNQLLTLLENIDSKTVRQRFSLQMLPHLRGILKRNR